MRDVVVVWGAVPAVRPMRCADSKFCIAESCNDRFARHSKVSTQNDSISTFLREGDGGTRLSLFFQKAVLVESVHRIGARGHVAALRAPPRAALPALRALRHLGKPHLA